MREWSWKFFEWEYVWEWIILERVSVRESVKNLKCECESEIKKLLIESVWDWVQKWEFFDGGWVWVSIIIQEGASVTLKNMSEWVIEWDWEFCVSESE